MYELTLYPPLLTITKVASFPIINYRHWYYIRKHFQRYIHQLTNANPVKTLFRIRTFNLPPVTKKKKYVYIYVRKFTYGQGRIWKFFLASSVRHRLKELLRYRLFPTDD